MIDSIAGGGDGVGRLEGKTVFVPLAAPGDQLKIRITQRGDRFDRAQIAEIDQPGPDRVTPPCDYFGRCGGCRLMHLAYPAQLEAKQKIVADALERIGKLEFPPFTVLPSPQPLGYRDRVRLQRHGDRLGYFAAGSHDFVPVDRCRLGDARIDSAFKESKRWLPQLRVTEQVEIRGEDDGYVHIPLARGVQPEFRQVNPGANELLSRWVFDQVDEIAAGSGGGPLSMLELFSGDGNFTLPILERGASATALEIDKRAAERLRKRAQERGVSQRLDIYAVDLFAGKVAVPNTVTRCDYDLVLLDPPRAGAKEALAWVATMKPKNILYVSCDPATLARDLRALKEAGGWRIESLACVDLFPQTAHVETVARLAR